MRPAAGTSFPSPSEAGRVDPLSIGDYPSKQVWCQPWRGVAKSPGEPAIVMVHITRALGAAVLGDSTQLAQHTAALKPLLPDVDGMYLTAPAHVLRAVAVARQIRTAPADERCALLAELDGAIDWLALRAADAPMNQDRGRQVFLQDRIRANKLVHNI